MNFNQAKEMYTRMIGRGFTFKQTVEAISSYWPRINLQQAIEICDKLPGSIMRISVQDGNIEESNIRYDLEFLFKDSYQEFNDDDINEYTRMSLQIVDFWLQFDDEEHRKIVFQYSEQDYFVMRDGDVYTVINQDGVFKTENKSIVHDLGSCHTHQDTNFKAWIIADARFTIMRVEAIGDGIPHEIYDARDELDDAIGEADCTPNWDTILKVANLTSMLRNEINRFTFDVIQQEE